MAFARSIADSLRQTVVYLIACTIRWMCESMEKINRF